MFSTIHSPLRGHVQTLTFQVFRVINFRGCIALGIPWAELTNANEHSWSQTPVHRIWFVAKELSTPWKHKGKLMGKWFAKSGRQRGQKHEPKHARQNDRQNMLQRRKGTN